MIIQKCRRNDLLVRMLSALHLHGCIHIYHQLQLQTVIQCRQIKFPVAGLIINDLDVDMLCIFRHIDTIDPSLQMHLLVLRQIHMNAVQILRKPERKFIIIWLETALFQMFLQGQHCTGQDPAHAGNGIFIPRRTV